MWDKKTLANNGGHSPECEQFCHSSCPIGQERKRQAIQRTIIAEKEWYDRKVLAIVEGR